MTEEDQGRPIVVSDARPRPSIIVEHEVQSSGTTTPEGHRVRPVRDEEV